ncbi:hypothetical protein H1D31_14590 [Alishewanella sp. BS5-314]|uniref:hypothetical protein n=1 Tax=Alishewanella sp. BS5-314 TaxID=2755587 RepID=UPI0021BA478D|nr:hypothetical protein [Alishewanella sp. BS5-314]MCT8127236.1 hypothetical protein [Alishewanella sp. BS5-314]
MEQSDKKLNKQISKYYVDHACQISSPGVVANELNLEPSRVSDLRAGRRQLTVEQAEKIKEVYGLPSTSQGHWMECELLSSQNLHKQFIDNGLALHYLQIIQAIKSEDFIKQIMRCCYFSDQSVPGYQSTAGIYNEDYRKVQNENEKIFLEFKLKYFNELLASDSFQTYCDSENKDMDPEFLNGLCKEINPNFSFLFNHSSSFNYKAQFFKFFRYLRVFRELVLSNTYANLVDFDKDLIIGGSYKINYMELPKKEYVIVGKVVWEIGAEELQKLTMPIANKGVCGAQVDEDCLRFSMPLYPKVFTHYSLKLYYS